MYSTQRLYLQENSFLDAMQTVGNSILNFFKSVEKGVAAAKAAQVDPTDREKILAILTGE